MLTVKLATISADVRPSDVCSTIIEEKHLFAGTLQRELEHLPIRSLSLFAAVQATEWGLDMSNPTATANSVAWKRIYAAVCTRKRPLRRFTCPERE